MELDRIKENCIYFYFYRSHHSINDLPHSKCIFCGAPIHDFSYCARDDYYGKTEYACKSCWEQGYAEQQIRIAKAEEEKKTNEKIREEEERKEKEWVEQIRAEKMANKKPWETYIE